MRRGQAFQLEEPPLTIPWGISPVQLQALFRDSAPEAGLRFVTDGYYVVRCTALGSLLTMVGFHFRPQSETGALAELEFFDNGSHDLQASFAVYQRHLELAFGKPSHTSAGSFSSDMPSYEWRRGRLRVSHFVMDRFGPEEHVRIVRRSWLTGWLT